MPPPDCGCTALSRCRLRSVDLVLDIRPDRLPTTWHRFEDFSDAELERHEAINDVFLQGQYIASDVILDLPEQLVDDEIATEATVAALLAIRAELGRRANR